MADVLASFFVAAFVGVDYVNAHGCCVEQPPAICLSLEACFSIQPLAGFEWGENPPLGLTESNLIFKKRSYNLDPLGGHQVGGDAMFLILLLMRLGSYFKLIAIILFGSALIDYVTHGKSFTT